MSARSKWLGGGSIACVGLLVCLVCVAAAPSPRPPVTTDHYTVSTDVSEEFTRLVAEHMEAIYGEYRRKLQGYELKVHGKFEVEVFARRADFDEAVPPSLKGSTGAFTSQDKSLRSFKEKRTNEAVFRTLYHEGFHQFMYTCITPQCPLWVNEGLAEYFSESTWNGKSFTTGQVPGDRLKVVKDAIRRKTHIPLKTLFAMKNDQWLRHIREDQSRASLQYCQAWSVVHFLVHAHNGRYRERLLGYLRRISEETDQEAAFRESFGTDVESFERAWMRHVAALKPTPDDVCRKNMRLIAAMALELYGKPEKFRSVNTLRRDMLGKRLSWTIVAGDGERITSKDERRAKALFRCPYDKSGRACSYTLLRHRRTGVPVLYCTHHRGVVLKAYYVRQKDTYKVVVEQQVRANVPRDVARALNIRD